ncbi:MAG TPA: TlpA disulfide reductase family protein [Thermoleophilaceae bacterium]|nr:TlpA disulfide reductase family protein [Thermoleophilaceae bacterium]
MRRVPAAALACIALVACVAVVAAGCGSDDEPSASPASAGEAPVFLDGGRDAFEKRIAAQKGTPVVVNKWASWCGPCRLEFPYFGDQARKRKGEVAFLGVNSNDSRGPAEEFVREHPVPFPHFDDPNLEIAAAFNAVQAFPSTAFYDRKGELAFVHQGPYTSEQDLAEAIDRYAR